MSDEIELINDPPTIRRGDFIACAFCRATLGGWLAGSMGHPPITPCECRGARVLVLVRELQARVAELTTWRPMATAPQMEWVLVWARIEGVTRDWGNGAVVARRGSECWVSQSGSFLHEPDLRGWRPIGPGPEGPLPAIPKAEVGE